MSANKKRKSEAELDRELDMLSTARNASKQSLEQNSSSIPEEIQDLRILDCSECFDKDSEIQALKKSKNDIKKEVTAKKYEIKVFEKDKKKFEKKIASMEILHRNLEKLNASAFKAFNEQNNELIIINNNLKAAVFNKNNEIKSLKERNNELENLQAEVDSKNSKLKVLQEAIVSTNDELMKVKQDFKAAVDSKNSELQALWNTNVLSNNEIEKVKQDLKTEIASKDNEIKALQELNESTRNELQRILMLTI